MAPDRSIAILGAAGFVGRHLLDQLEAAGVRVTAVVRGFPELAVEGDYHAVLSPDEARAGGPYDVVINLAYPTAGSPFEQPILNAAILESVDELVADGGHVVHASTLAVFGTRLERPIRVAPVEAVRDRPYVESKIEAELALTDAQERRGLAVDIVRLGNIWGAASGTWALPIVQRLITGRPVGAVARGRLEQRDRGAQRRLLLPPPGDAAGRAGTALPPPRRVRRRPLGRVHRADRRRAARRAGLLPGRAVAGAAVGARRGAQRAGHGLPARRASTRPSATIACSARSRVR